MRGRDTALPRGPGFSQPNWESPQGWYLVRGPCLLLSPVPVAPHVPPLDLQRVGGGATAAEGAGHLHVLACPCRHVMGCLCEQSCAKKWGEEWPGLRKWKASRHRAGGGGGVERVGAARPAGGIVLSWQDARLKEQAQGLECPTRAGLLS